GRCRHLSDSPLTDGIACSRERSRRRDVRKPFIGLVSSCFRGPKTSLASVREVIVLRQGSSRTARHPSPPSRRRRRSRGCRAPHRSPDITSQKKRLKPSSKPSSASSPSGVSIHLARLILNTAFAHNCSV